MNTGEDTEEAGSEGDLTKTKTFWIYFPEARKVLANTSVSNEHNDAQRYSFDDLFFFRRFSSYIIREGNVFNNRQISAYTLGGIPNMVESDKIKEDITNEEHDLWEF